MRKLVLLLLCTVIIFACSCNQPMYADGDTSVASEQISSVAIQDAISATNIYMISDYVFRGNDIDSVQIDHVVSVENTFTVEDDVASVLNMEILGNDVTLSYVDTVYIVLGDMKLHRYAVNGNADDMVLIDDSGSLKRIVYDFAFMGIESNDSPDTVSSLLKPMLSPYVDLSKYESVEERDVFEGKDGSFGAYWFWYVNKKGGYITDVAEVVVHDTGRISSLSVIDLPVEVPDFEVDREREDSLLNAALEEIFTTETREYISYAVYTTPQIIVYNDELTVMYSLITNYLDKTNNCEISNIGSYLLPLRLLTTEPLPEIETISQSETAPETQSPTSADTEATT